MAEQDIKMPKLTTLRIAGAREVRAEGFDSASTRDGRMKVEAWKSVVIEPSRAVADSFVLPNVPDNTVVQVELDAGIKIWTTIGQLRADIHAPTARGEAPDEFVLPSSLQFGAPSRGLGNLIIKGLRLFNVDLGELLAKDLCSYWETKTLVNGTGFFRLVGARGNVSFEKIIAPQAIPTDKPILLFIHGTASSTAGSFSELWADATSTAESTNNSIAGKSADIWAELRVIYGDNIFALEHRTLTESPIKNALDCINALPAGARLHLVSHSRGGMVGELLCRGTAPQGKQPFDEHAKKLLAGRPDQSKDLGDLNRELLAKRLTIERFIRVACPSRGTSLASERLDLFFSLLSNVAGRILPKVLDYLVECLTDLAVAVAKERTDPNVIPGLEAMIPGSPLVRILNTSPEIVDADLTVIGGDIEASGVLGTVTTVITDIFLYDDDHDLVVDTRYMFGGSRRRAGTRYMFDHGGNVNHFCYFKNEKTAVQLLRGLKGEAEGFKAFEIGKDQLDQAFYRKRGVTPMPTLFVLPGIMGSHLKANGDRIWLDFFDLAGGGLVDDLHIDAPNIEAEAPIGKYYGNLINFLADTHDVKPFAYDWRKSVSNSADRLAQEVSQALDRTEATQLPVRILAHSMGGLVARALIARHPELWRRMCQREGNRLLMLGTPNRGSFVIPRTLMAEEKLVKQLAMIDIHHSEAELLKVIAAFPGFLEMLPEKAGDMDYFDPAFWDRINRMIRNRCAVPAADALSSARATRAELSAATLNAQQVAYVAGLAPATPCALEIDEQSRQIRILATPRGDGRVTWESGIPQGVNAWYIPAEHGDMADYEDGFEGYLELLQKGATLRLSRTPLADARAVAERTILPTEKVSAFPDSADLMAGALGGSSRPKSRRTEVSMRKVQIGVTHGDLAFVAQPIVVGHYTGDTIVSAEGYLDRVLGGQLRKRLSLGLYPGPLDTAEVFLNSARTPGGAVVIGLGKVGDLTPGGLARAFRRGILEYAIACEQTANSNQNLELRLASLLIGTCAGGFPIEQAAAAMLRGVIEANALLEQKKCTARVAELEFIEIYEDLAIQAAHTLIDSRSLPEFKNRFAVRDTIKSIDGRRRRAAWEEPGGWWHRLIISTTAAGELKFTTPTQRARAEVETVVTQRAVVDQFLTDAISTTRLDPNLGGTLFEMLLPNQLKEFAPDKQDIVVVLDADAARYPWELMFDPLSSDREPLAVQAGMLRQFETASYREQPVMATEQNALVIGDPDYQAPLKFPQLSGAKAEAEEVINVLGQNKYEVTPVIRKTSRAILDALFTKPYRILHLAGHGVFEYVDNITQNRQCPICNIVHSCEHKVSGMVIGPNAFLTPAIIQQMRRVPEFVFINCCHLGNMAGEVTRQRHALAANLATQLIRMGVRTVIAAGWAVDDRAAVTFARKFYSEFLSGTYFGQSVLLARRQTHLDHPMVNTWGAYQCYGDPDFTLNQHTNDSNTGDGGIYVSPTEPVVALGSA